MKAQKAIVLVTSNVGLQNERTSGLDELNDLLSKGWVMKETLPMTAAGSGNGGAYGPAFALFVRVYEPE